MLITKIGILPTEDIKMIGNIVGCFTPINQTTYLKWTTLLIDEINKTNRRGNRKSE